MSVGSSKSRETAAIRANPSTGTVSDERRIVLLRRGSVAVSRGDGGAPAAPAAIDEGGIYVGRAEGCTVRVADRKVSSVHLSLAATERGIRVEDLRSRNGTYLGSARITEAFLTERTQLSIGDTVLTVIPFAPESVPLLATQACGALAGGPVMWGLFEQLRAVAPTDLTVLITGETGCGKEVVAREIHQRSQRAGGPFVVVDCGSIPSTLAESTLFGHERGAFTGATERRLGPFVEAKGGTVFLDEIGELPTELQPKLLRVLAERVVQSVGSNRYVPVDVRVVAATRRSMAQEINKGAFRSDLFFRMAQVSIELPPLRRRIEDLPLLMDQILADLGRSEALSRLVPGTIERLQRHDWPGNVRELKNLLQVATALHPSGPIDLARYLCALPLERSELPTPDTRALLGLRFKDAKRRVLDDFEREYFARLYEEAAQNLSEMGRRAGLHRDYVRKYLVQHGVLKVRESE